MDLDLYAQIESFSTKLTMNTISFLMRNGELVKHKAGDIVVREGEPSTEVYILMEGQAAVEKRDHLGNPIRIAKVETGSLIGEMGVLLDMKRSATIVAHTDITLVRFTNENFINALPKTPDLVVRLLKSLADKVNLVNQKYANLLLKNDLLVLGVYILGTGISSTGANCDISLDLRQVSSQSKMPIKKVKSILEIFQKNEIIGKMQFRDEHLCHFHTDLRQVRAFLKGLSAVQ